MRSSSILLLAVLAAVAPAQGRLVDRIEAPMLYVSLEGAPAAAAPASRREIPPGQAATSPAASPVQKLLADPAFDTLFGRDGAGEGSAGRALTLVRGVLARSSGDLELALTGVLPAGGQPLLVLRARLQNGEAARLQGLLDGPDLARHQRVVGGHQTWSLRSRASRAVEPGPGELVELSLVGDDLMVANDMTAMEELLGPADQRTAATSRRLVLSADPRFTSLKKRLDVPAGSLLVYGDWLRLSQRLQTSTEGLPSFLLSWSGLGSARSVMASVAGSGSDFTGTMLLDFDRDAARDAGSGRPDRGRPEHGRPDGGRPDGGRPDRHDGPGGPVGPGGPGPGPGGEPNAIDGWFGAAQSVPARTLLSELPASGLGGLVLAVDLAQIAQRSRRGMGMLRELHDAFEEFGLDFERNVLSQLGTRGTVQLLFRRGGDAAATELVSVYSLRAKSRKAAADLFADLRRAAEQRGMGKIVVAGAARDRKGVDVLELSHRRGDRPTCLAILEDLVLVGADADSLVQVIDDGKRAAKQRGKRDAAVTAAVQSIGGENVAGLFDLDFTPLFERVVAAFGAGSSSGGTADSAARLDLSRIPKRHIGYLDLQPRDGGIVLRIRVLSSS